MMNKKLAIALLALVAACSDTTGPTEEAKPVDVKPVFATYEGRPCQNRYQGKCFPNRSAADVAYLTALKICAPDPLTPACGLALLAAARLYKIARDTDDGMGDWPLPDGTPPWFALPRPNLWPNSGLEPAKREDIGHWWLRYAN